MSQQTQSLVDALDTVIGRARQAGASAADAVGSASASTTVAVRLDALESVERSEDVVVGLRVLFGRRQAVASSSDLSAKGLETLVDRVVAMARAAPEDPFCGLPDTDRLVDGEDPGLDLADADEPDADRLTEMARSAEQAARGVAGVTNSDGATARARRLRTALVNTDGLAGIYETTEFVLSASVVAGTGTAMERDYDYAATRHLADLDDPQTLGRNAAERAVRRLNPRKAATATVPVVFDPRAAGSLLAHFADAVNGQTVARGASFLNGRLGETVFAPGVTVIDDPRRVRGIRSKPFDGEGTATRTLTLVEDGRLCSWLMNAAAARQLELATTGHAKRRPQNPPDIAETNLYMAPGPHGPDALIADIAAGFYVTELIGMGVNGVTGDYSRGAAGFWIEDGTLAYPVSEVTIAGNLADMFKALTPASDLTFRYPANAPTLRVDGMTVAGA